MDRNTSGALTTCRQSLPRTSSQQSSVNIAKLGILLPLLPFEPALTSFLCMVICIYLAFYLSHVSLSSAPCGAQGLVSHNNHQCVLANESGLSLPLKLA